MTAIMLYLLLVSCGVAAAAAIAERAAAAADLPKRPVWLCAMLASTGLPVLALATGRSAGGASTGEAATLTGTANPGDAVSAAERGAASSSSSSIDWQQLAAWNDWVGWQLVDATAWPAAAALDQALAGLWLASSALVLFGYLAAWFWVRRLVRSWPQARIAGAEVVISDRFGPALFGLARPRIIVPRWLLREPNPFQITVIEHERAHAAAKDAWWLAVATLAVALLPWNPVMWWQLHRLRMAIELDCDARVVRGGADAESYAGVLIAVAERHAAAGRSLPLLGAVGSTGRPSQLERRVRQVILRPGKNRRVAVLGGAGAAFVLAAAWLLEPPTMAQTRAADADAGDPGAVVARQPLTGLATGGERVAVLVDVSATMLDRSVEGVQRWLEASPEERRRAPKWTHLVETVDSVIAQIPPSAQFQMILFNDQARAAIPGTNGQWLTATPALIDGSIDALRSVVTPEGPSSLRAAFEAVDSLDPPPDTVHLIVDGLPTAEVDPADSESERMDHLLSVIESVPSGAAVNVLLMPRDDDAIAAPAYWVLTHRTGGALFAPVEGAMQSAVPGVPLDAEYLIFVVDTSGSMLTFAWESMITQLEETLAAYTQLRGIQVMTDMGQYLFREYDRGEWILPEHGREVIETIRTWQAFSNSTPREAISTTLRDFHDPEKKIDLHIYGDDHARGSIDAVVREVDRLNIDEEGNPRVRIHAVAFPALQRATGGEQYTAADYATLMRVLTQRNGGTFIALPE